MTQQLELQLNDQERKDLANYEETISNGILSFIEVGQALEAIKEQSLFRETHRTFNDYCRERWGFAKNYANRLIKGATVAMKSVPIGITSESQARELAMIPEEHREEVMQEVAAQGPITAKAIKEVGQAFSGKTPRDALHSSDSDDWYTPEYIIESARKVMGSIDLDPASCEEANGIVKAGVFYSSDGLSKEWFGNVWCNPPYGRDDEDSSNQAQWSRHATWHYEGGLIDRVCLLVNAAIGTKWFADLGCFWACLFDTRIRFWGHGKNHPTNGNALIYMGDNHAEFHDEFSQYGRIVIPRYDVKCICEREMM